MSGWGDTSDRMQRFLAEDAARRSGGGSSIEDRYNEGALISSLLGPVAPVATVPVGLAGAAYEGVKGLGQATGLGQYLPGPFKTDETTSPASMENIIGLLRGYTSGWGR